MPKNLSAADRKRVVEMAEKATAKECRRLGIPCFVKGGDGYTDFAQEIFNEAYDNFEGVILSFRRR